MKKFARLLALFAGIALLMGADTRELRYQNVGGKIMCSCGCGQMLLKCNHVGCPNSAKMIGQLRTQLAKTDNDEDVLQFFRNEWGVTMVVEPGHHGFELLAWILPFTGLGVGILLLIVVVRRWSLKPAPINPADAQLDPQLEAFRAQARKETEV
jgi:cytochrome c-type biogenesis protein CcmH